MSTMYQISYSVSERKEHEKFGVQTKKIQKFISEGAENETFLQSAPTTKQCGEDQVKASSFLSQWQVKPGKQQKYGS